MKHTEMSTSKLKTPAYNSKLEQDITLSNDADTKNSIEANSQNVSDESGY